MESKCKFHTRVRFDQNVKVLKMCVWSHAYQQARTSNWMRIAFDRYRFQRRIMAIEQEISWVFTEIHRAEKLLERMSKE